MKSGLVICLAAASLWAEEAPKKTFYITTEQLDVASMLVSPPAPDSWQTRVEVAELHRLQATRSAAEIARAKADDEQEDMFVFGNVMGAGFTAERLPATKLLSAHLHSDEGVIVDPAKRAFHRSRPYFFDSSIQPVCKLKTDPKDYSYPSGHATTGYLEAFTLAMMVPEKRDEILARADDYAHNRLVCGVHYPADLAASKATAYAMIAIMLQNPQFKKEFAAARAETRYALGF